MLKKLKFSKPEDEFKDLGLGAKFSEQHQRLINIDGSFHIKRKNMPFFDSLSFYHELISMSWWKFNLIVVLSFTIVNTFFGLVYMLIGVNELQGVRASTDFGRFLEEFFFSAQTLTTVGFGRISPIGTAASTVAAIESLLGLLGFALATGLLYGRFSRPNAKIHFSKNSLISPYKEINGFMFRLINARKNQLIELEIQVVFSRLELNNDGHQVRHYYNLKLERDKVNFFPVNWTVVHPITQESPIYSTTLDEMRESGAEFLILLKAFDDSFSQTVHTRHSYTYEELIWGAKFENVFTNVPGEIPVFDMHKFHLYKKAELNNY